MLAFPLVFGVAFLTSLLLAPLTATLGLKLGFVDVPGGRRIHREPRSRLGGVALFASFMLATGLTLVLPPRFMPPRYDPKELTRLTGVLVGSAFIFLVGLYDDKVEMKPFPQLLAQVIAALIAISFLVFIERVMNPFTDQLVIFPFPFTVAFTIFWIAGMINTVNFLDGLDGLAAGVGAIVCAILSLHMWREGQLSVALLPLALLGSTLGFLPYNFNPAKVFMGSCGSFFLGYALGTLSIIAGAKVATILLVMGVPIMDVAWLILQRTRQGHSIFQADRSHLHHRLYDLGLSQRQVVLIYYSISALFGSLVFILSSRLYKLYAVLLLGFLTGLSLWFLSPRSHKSS
ncbi:MAG: undecaprenyl/decaprenyl-phosphate alpha-N-acetylglucosaminyl 1-phosphate transferase [Chloroflexi bacterium]|nr:MAG: undecaprenyl/decaprenyl-phosphate alpha-N-acetylglucosaminyl 1-phosphate transferase [Chloroflexota bacterium]HDN79812.1 undecaprenyl/decaprenyl-phosphate alpha-N-acetylglucosaminyl 1-phosphate transferase [Chloroflexota bacterium]